MRTALRPSLVAVVVALSAAACGAQTGQGQGRTASPPPPAVHGTATAARTSRGPVRPPHVHIDPSGRTAHTDDADCRTALADALGVLIVGDSLTVGSADLVTASLARVGIPVCLDARVGRNSGEGNTVLRTFLDRGLLRRDATVVMAFGANDTHQPGGWGTCQATTALAAIGADARLLWVNGYNAQSDEQLNRQRAFNAEIDGVAGETSRLGVVDWYAVAYADSGLIHTDRVHPNSVGKQRWTELVSESVLRAPDHVFPGDTIAARCPAVSTAPARTATHARP